VIPDDRQGGGQRLDVVGALLVTASTAALIYGLSNSQQHGLGTPATVLTFAATVVLALAFVQVERTVAEPMLPFRFFAAPLHRVALEVALLLGGVIAGYVYFASLYMQDVLRSSALLTGLAFLPATGTVIVTSMFVARRLLGRLGIKGNLFVGLPAIAIGQLLLSSMRTGGTYAVAVLPGMLVTSFGMGLVFLAVAVAAMGAVAKNE
jgi:hypothetical protein